MGRRYKVYAWLPLPTACWGTRAFADRDSFATWGGCVYHYSLTHELHFVHGYAHTYITTYVSDAHWTSSCYYPVTCSFKCSVPDLVDFQHLIEITSTYTLRNKLSHIFWVHLIDIQYKVVPITFFYWSFRTFTTMYTDIPSWIIFSKFTDYDL